MSVVFKDENLLKLSLVLDSTELLTLTASALAGTGAPLFPAETTFEHLPVRTFITAHRL